MLDRACMRSSGCLMETRKSLIRMDIPAHPKCLPRKANKMNRRELTGGLTAATLYTSRAGAEWLAGNVAALPMTELQQQFLDLRFGMYIHLNMATYEQREWGDPKA